MIDSVLIDGVRYVPDPTHVNRVSFWWMHDNHTFTRLKGNTLSEVVQNAKRVRAETPYGSLCPAILCHDKKEVRRVGKMIFDNPTHFSKWQKDLTDWCTTMESDADIMRVLSEGGNHE